MSRLPDFLLVGSMKSGTTTLYQHLCLHPDIFMCTPKEPQFFSLDDNYSRGIQWYASLFAAASDNQVIGEASTCYSRWPYHPDVVGRMGLHIPDAKFIYIMRDPVERVYSHYKHRMEERFKQGKSVLSFHEALAEDPEIFDTGLYARQIGRYLDAFPRDQILLLILEEFVADPARACSGVFEFLGIRDLQIDSQISRFNQSGSNVANARVKKSLRGIRRLPILKQVVDGLPAATRSRLLEQSRCLLLQSPVGHYLARDFQARVEPYAASSREEMRRRYRSGIADLEGLLGRKLHCWTGRE